MIVERVVTLKTCQRVRKFAEWTDAAGQPKKAPLNAAGTRIVLPPAKDAPLLIVYTDPQTGRRRTRKVETSNKEIAKATRSQLIDRAHRRALGLADMVTETATTPVADVVDEWFACQRSLRASQQKMHVLRIIEGIDATRAHEIDEPKVLAFLGGLRAEAEAGKIRFSETTEAEYRQSVQRFTKWAAKNRRIPFDPLADLPKISRAKAKLAHERRAITTDQLAALLDVTQRRTVDELRTIRRGPRKGRLEANVRPKVLVEATRRGRYYRLAYLLAFYPRLRRSEIKALRWGNIHRTGDVKKITLRRHRTKARREDSIPIHPALDAALAEFWHPSIDPSARVCLHVPNMKAHKADLRAAGIPYELDGLFADFHSMGKTFVTACAVNGVSQRAAQGLARHSDPRLTSGPYTDERLIPLAHELAKVPDVTCTGGNGRADQVPARAAPAQRLGGTGTQNVAQTCANEAVVEEGRATTIREQKPPKTPENCIKRHDPAPVGTGSESEAGEGGRTLDIHVGNVTLYH